MKIKPGDLLQVESRFGSIARFIYLGTIRIKQRKYRVVFRIGKDSKYTVCEDDFFKQFKDVKYVRSLPDMASKRMKRFLKNVVEVKNKNAKSN